MGSVSATDNGLYLGTNIPTNEDGRVQRISL